jgi:hypothetical protein
MPSYKTAFGSFLKAEDLQGKVVNIAIDRVSLESVKDQESGKDEQKLVAHFAGKDKGLILNRTNADALNAIFGTDDYDFWRGVVQLFVDPNVRFGNRTVAGLRIRAAGGVQQVTPPPPPPVDVPTVVTDEDIPF